MTPRLIRLRAHVREDVTREFGVNDERHRQLLVETVRFRSLFVCDPEQIDSRQQRLHGSHQVSDTFLFFGILGNEELDRIICDCDVGQFDSVQNLSPDILRQNDLLLVSRVP